MSPPTLRTERLLLVPLADRHVELEVQLDADPEVLRYISGRARHRDEVLESHVRRMELASRVVGLGFWMAFASEGGAAGSTPPPSEEAGEFVGLMMLPPAHGPDQPDDLTVSDLGYRLHRDYWGKGLASEASRTLLRHAFETVGQRRVIAQTMAVNTGSRRVMEAIGMQYVRTYFPPWDDPLPGADLGEVEYEMTRAMWEKQTHADEWDIDAALVTTLIAAQFPKWANLPLVKLPSAGTDHAMFRLADDMVVRLPRMRWVARQVEAEQRWLPHVAPHLPLPVPVPLGRGVPDQGFPMPWSVYAWLDGENAFETPIVDLHNAAIELGGFVAALRRVDAAGGPTSFRGGPIATSGYDVRTPIRDLASDGTIDAAAATAAWEQVLALPQWEGAPVWLHGDLMPGNLLTRHGRLTGVIDFGVLGVGDPACDLIPAWYVFEGETRDLFRAAADVDDATWARGRGWALCLGLGAEHYYRTKNPALAAAGRRAMLEALAG